MTKPIFWIACCCLLSTQSWSQFQLPTDSSFYTFLDSFYVYYQDDSTEGGIYNKVRRDKMTWGPRLAPSGHMSKANQAILDYTKLYNGSNNAANSAPPVGTVPIVIPPVHPLASNWKELGPTQTIQLGDRGKGMGQIHRIAFHPSYDGSSNQTIYAGSHYGGLFRTDDGGANWYNYHTDRGLPLTSIGGIAVSPSRVFVCTGNGDHGYASFGLQGKYDPLRGSINDANPVHTQGVYYNHTNNNNWIPINGDSVRLIDGTTASSLLEVFEQGGTMRNIIVHPSNDNILLIATSQGIFRTSNRGFYWEQVLVGPAAVTGGFLLDTEWRGLAFHPTNPNIVYASGQDIYKSVDGGLTWTNMTNQQADLPLPWHIRRINIAVTPAAPDALYAYVIGYTTSFSSGQSRVYWYQNGNWALQNTAALPGAPDWAAIAVSPSDPQVAYVGNISTHKLINIGALGAANKVTTPAVGIHDDVHALCYAPNSSGGIETIFAGTHGGVSKLREGDTTWSTLYDGLAVATIWAFDDWEGNDSLIALSQQDVGTNVSIDNGGNWQQRAGEDGYGTRIDNQSGDIYYLQNWGGSFYRLPMSRPLNQMSSKVYEGRGLPSLVPSTFPMENHPENDSLYFGFSGLYLRNSHSWMDSLVSIDTIPAGNIIPGTNLTSNEANCDTYVSPGNNRVVAYWVQPGNPPFQPPGYCVIESYVVTIEKWKEKSDIQKYQSHSGNRRIMEIAFSEDENSNYTYLVSLGDNNHRRSDLYFNNGLNCDTCFVRKNAGLPMDSLAPTLDPNPITGIAVDPLDGKRLWLSFSGYSKAIKVYYSSDSGSTWTSYDDANNSLANLNVPINNIVYQRGTKDRLYIATDVGVYVREDGGDWLRYGENFPNVRTTELKINYCSGKLRAATFGRGAWEADLLPAETSINYRSFRVVSGYEQWSKDKNMSRDILVKSSGTLVLDSMLLNMPKDGLIVVEAGGLLMVNGSTITNLCGQTWQGIQVWGQSAMSQTFSNQGTIVLDGATIEYAKNAISPWQVGNYPDMMTGTGGTGGIVWAENSSFVNNWRSIDFMFYRHFSQFKEQSRLNNCTFTVNDAYRPFNQDSLPFFLGHISMWGVGGTDIRGCTFKDERSYKVGDAATGGSYGIATLGASPYLRRHLYWDKRNRFEGLERALELAGPRSTPLSSVVDECTFVGNEQAVAVRAHNHALIVRDSFSIGGFGVQYNNPYIVEEYGLGLMANTAFSVEQNVFQASTTDETVGTWVEDAGSGGTEIRNNQYYNLTGANLAHGRNSGIGPFANGLQYLCNKNHQNSHDFLVFPNITSNLASASIGARQGRPTQASRNTLSTAAQTFPAQTQFYNYSYNPSLGQLNPPIAYYYTNSQGAVEIPDPSLLLNVNRLVASQGPLNFCADHYTGIGIFKIANTEGTPLSLESLKANYYSSKASYISLKEEYHTLDPTDSSLVQAQEGELAGVHREVFFWANQVIHAYSNDSLAWKDSIAVWIQKKPGLEAAYELVEHYWRWGAYSTALQLIEDIPLQYTLEERAVKNHGDYKRLKNLLYTAYQAGRVEATLEKEEVDLLEEIALAKWGFAAVQAGNILRFFYQKGVIYYPTLPSGQEVEGRYTPPSHSNTLVFNEGAILLGNPNPAINWVDLSYQLPKDSKQGQLVVTATTGAKVHQVSLYQATGQITLNTKDWAAGIYFATLYAGEKKCKVFKIIIQK